MTIRAVEEFKEAAERQGVLRWPIRSCSICGYELAYLIGDGRVFYDAGCHCSSYGPAPMEPRTWEDLADHYNRNQPENNPRISESWLRETDAFWGFGVNDATVKAIREDG